MNFLKHWEILFTKWYNLFPNKKFNKNEIINSLFRFGIILFIIIFSLEGYYYLYIIPLFFCFISIFLGIINEYLIVKHKYVKDCKLPEASNPFVNDLYSSNKKNLPACLVSHNIKDYMNKFNLYTNSNDIFKKMNLTRQFYTMPVTQKISNTQELGNWLYKTNGNCKYNLKNCL